MPEVLTTILFAFVGLLFIGLAQPFIRGTVPPNRLSGLRVRATFADPAVWYAANAATGRDLALPSHTVSRVTTRGFRAQLHGNR
jgi:hypothetical protein